MVLSRVRAKVRKLAVPTIIIGALDWFGRYETAKDLLTKLMGYRVAAFISFSAAWLSPVILVIGFALLFLSRHRAIGAADWSSLGTRFQQIPSTVRADWIGQVGGNAGPVKDTWRVRGGIGERDCEALCRLAGAMLLRSPHISLRLSEIARSQTDHAWRWLYFMKENHGAAKDNGRTDTTFRQSIDNLGAVSARVCIECSAEET